MCALGGLTEDFYAETTINASTEVDRYIYINFPLLFDILVEVNMHYFVYNF